MYIEGFGEKEIQLYEIEGTEELLELEFTDNEEVYSAVIDCLGRILVPISKIPLVEAFATNDKTNYCFTRLDEESGSYESFHLQKFEDGDFCLIADIKGNEHSSCRLVSTVKDDYWFIETVTDDIIEVALYDVRKGSVLTPSFADISFEKENSRVLAFVEKEIYTCIDDEIVYLTSLLSYIDYNGNFIAPFYDTDKEVDSYYDLRSYNFDKSFKSYNRFIESVTSKHRKRYIEHSEHVSEVLTDMFNNLYSEDEINKKQYSAKILEYKRSKVDDEK